MLNVENKLFEIYRQGTCSFYHVPFFGFLLKYLRMHVPEEKKFKLSSHLICLRAKDSRHVNCFYENLQVSVLF